MQKEFEETDRPWVDVNVDIAGPLVFFAKDTIGQNIHLALSNTGHSPALNVSSDVKLFNFDLRDIKNGGDFLPEMHRICSGVLKHSAEPDVGSALFPGDKSIELRTVYMVIQSDRIISPQLVGCVSYKFPFGNEPHWTGFIGLIAAITKDPQVFVAPIPGRDASLARNLRIIRYKVFGD